MEGRNPVFGDSPGTGKVVSLNRRNGLLSSISRPELSRLTLDQAIQSMNQPGFRQDDSAHEHRYEASIFTRSERAHARGFNQ